MNYRSSTLQRGRPYTYEPVNGAFEIVNGPGRYNRPLYGPHCRDDARFDEKFIAVAGDSPNALLVLTRSCPQVKMGNLILGLENGKWFEAFTTIKARYCIDCQDYELSDEQFDGRINLALARPVEFEGLLVRVRLPPGRPDRLVVACGGATTFANGKNIAYLDVKEFDPADCEACRVKTDAAGFEISKENAGHDRILRGVFSGAVEVAVRDASALQAGPAALLAAKPVTWPLAIGLCRPDEQGEIYIVLTIDPLILPAVQKYLRAPASGFEKCRAYYRKLSQTMRVKTPDKYLNLGMASQILAMDAAWHPPVFVHGPWSWHTPYAGWRGCYGPTTLGWHDRVQSSTSAFFPLQIKTPEYSSVVWHEDGFARGAEFRGGLQPELLGNKEIFYNMGEVLVDHILYDWEWTGDLEFMTRAFDFITDRLLWEERCLDADNDGLYENWLNTWISDNHWYNGGGCIQASVYNWRANRVMADVAKRLGRDPDVFEQRAAKIKKACVELLWIADRGVFGEYKDAIGLKRVHPAPEQASLYHPIDFRFCDEFQAYQMLRYSEYAIRNELDTVPRGGRLVWSSDWLPVHYSSLGLYPQETINLMLCYYRLGLAEKADALLKGIEAAFFMGPYPGGIAHNQKPDGSCFGSPDFTDTTSMFIRAVAEGLFGIWMNVPDREVTVQPCFPRDWRRAELRAADIEYRYQRQKDRELIKIKTSRQLRHKIKIMARQSRIKTVLLNGAEVVWQVKPGIGRCWIMAESGETSESAFEIVYEGGALPELEYDSIGAIGENYRVNVRNGRMLRLFDPQEILEETELEESHCVARLKARSGWHTFFILVESERLQMWLPVDLELRPPLEIVAGRLFLDGSAREYQRHRLCCRAALQNNLGRNLFLTGELRIGNSRVFIDRTLKKHAQTEPIEFTISDPSELTPGSNVLSILINGSDPDVVKGVLTDWAFAARMPQMAKKLSVAAPISLDGLRNLNLGDLHKQKYLSPRPATYSITTDVYGRIIWDWNARGYKVVEPHFEKLPEDGSLFMSDIGIPFVVPGKGLNACVTSLWDNFPDSLVIPVKRRARKIYFLLAASTNPMQSHIENGRITVETAIRRLDLPLVNPDNLDDWLNTPYARSGYIQYLGELTHGLILDLDLDGVEEVRNITLACQSNEILIALLGVTMI